MVKQTKFPTELKLLKYEIEQHAKDYGLDFFEVIFEMVDYDRMSQIAAYGGFPVRYPHWRFGMEYEQLSKGYAYGLQKIYEMVVNTDPCYAYLLTSNDLVDQKLVIAHVYGHCDFFKNNLWFAKTNRKMMDEMANHGSRIRSYMERQGVDEVEDFIDACLSVEDLIDPHQPFIQRRNGENQSSGIGDGEEEVHRLKSKAYMDSYVNPASFIKEQQDQLETERENRQHFPAEPEQDVLRFLIENAPLQAWQQHVLSMIREEAYYFAPQRQTKIMNEGWASYWHSTILTQKMLNDGEIIDFAEHHAGTMGTQPGRINPYKLGLELFNHIEDRWNKGKFGHDYETCQDLNELANWDRQLGLGREKIFEVARVYNDVEFIDAFLTEEFCREYKLFSYGYNQASHNFEIQSREFDEIKRKLLFSLTNAGRPFIFVVDGNYRNRGELLLRHRSAQMGLDLSYAKATLINLRRLWSRPVHLETRQGEQAILLSCEENQVELSKI